MRSLSEVERTTMTTMTTAPVKAAQGQVGALLGKRVTEKKSKLLDGTPPLAAAVVLETAPAAQRRAVTARAQNQEPKQSLARKTFRWGTMMSS